MSQDDPFGRRDEDDRSGVPGGWLPPSSQPEQEPERRPLWDRPAGEGDRIPPPVFEQPGSHPTPSAPPAGGGGTSGRATASLVLGILGLIVCPFVCSVLAIVFGRRARREIDASGGAIRGRGNATAGIVLGWIGLAFAVLFILLVVVGTVTLDEGGGGGGDDPLFSLVASMLP